MLTLTEISTHFAGLDMVQRELLPQYDKALRHLTQRNHLPVADQRGRAFYYDEAGAAAIRIAQIANEAGLHRATMEVLTAYLSQTYKSDAFPSNPGLQPRMIDEAVRRTRANEVFALQIVMTTDYRFRCNFDWPRKQQSERVSSAVTSAGLIKDGLPELSRLILPASRLIADVLQAFEG